MKVSVEKTVNAKEYTLDEMLKSDGVYVSARFPDDGHIVISNVNLWINMFGIIEKLNEGAASWKMDRFYRSSDRIIIENDDNTK